MPPRFFVPWSAEGAQPDWVLGAELDMPSNCVRHLQVLRLQPGDAVLLFNGRGGQWQAQIEHMGRSNARVSLTSHEALERELPIAVTLAVCMPANDRMDDLVEKATELGVAAIQPLMSNRSVLRLSGERALKKQVHWQAVAASACEQSGRNRVPVVGAVQSLGEWLAASARPAGQASDAARWQLSLEPTAVPLAQAWQDAAPRGMAGGLLMLSGPEGGLDPQEQAAASLAGHHPVSLGRRTLRADTAPLAALAAVGVLAVGGDTAEG